jgi:membrane associated rhomboid family serine protease
MPIDEIEALKKEVGLRISYITASLTILWSVWLVNLIFFHNSLNQFGIKPRTPDGLLGILFYPFLHASFSHILNNSISFILFGVLILLRDIRTFLTVTLFAVLISGLGIWLFGSPHSVHIGASGVIFGYFGYCISVGFIEKKLSTIIFSAAIIVLYGGMIFGILPLQNGISWEGHLFGLIGGVLAAVALHKKSLPDARF